MAEPTKVVEFTVAVTENIDENRDVSVSSSEKKSDSVDRTSGDISLADSEPKRATPCSQQTSKDKIDLLLKATGDAPIMKQKKWSVEADRKIGGIIQFVKKYLKLEPQDTLFLYVNQSFAPAPDQILGNLYECFGAEGKLVLHYCKTQAWG